MLDRSQIGRDNGERFIDVERGQLRLFCKAIGETDPIFLDDEAARAAGHPAIPVPPTFAQTLNYLAPQGEDLVIDVLQADLGKLLHGEQRYEYQRPIYVGDRIRLLTRIVDIYDKKGGALEFVVLDTTLHNQRDELCATMRTVAVLRH
jgi:acyl dehydratase